MPSVLKTVNTENLYNLLQGKCLQLSWVLGQKKSTKTCLDTDSMASMPSGYIAEQNLLLWWDRNFYFYVSVVWEMSRCFSWAERTVDLLILSWGSRTGVNEIFLSNKKLKGWNRIHNPDWSDSQYSRFYRRQSRLFTCTLHIAHRTSRIALKDALAVLKEETDVF